MPIHIHADAVTLGRTAGKEAAALLRTTLASRPVATLVLATGTSQLETMNTLVAAPGIAWDRVTVFHLDEYIGLSALHKASFRKYIQDRFISRVGKLKEVFLINGETILSDEVRRLNSALLDRVADVALVGIGENGHLAFNDPPANFDTEDPYIVVDLDEACRQQQLGEGWFRTINEVPRKAISMSVRQIMKSKHIVCSVPDARKANAVRSAFSGEVTNHCPASILQQHPNCHVHLDVASAAMLPAEIRKKAE